MNDTSPVVEVRVCVRAHAHVRVRGERVCCGVFVARRIEKKNGECGISANTLSRTNVRTHASRAHSDTRSHTDL
jgi:hypothetical protein